jgi:hypothetical protein
VAMGSERDVVVREGRAVSALLTFGGEAVFG